LELERHNEIEHKPARPECKKCDFVASDDNMLKVHEQSKHMGAKVNIDRKEQIVIACGECEYTCSLNIQMKKHLKENHEETPKYICKECRFTSNYIYDAWKHGFEEHPENPTEFKPQLTENMILMIVAEQNTVMIEEMATLKSDIKDSFDQLTDFLKTNIGGLKEDTEEKCKTLADGVSKLDERVLKQNKPTKTFVRNLNYVKSSGCKLKANAKHSSSSHLKEDPIAASSNPSSSTSASKPPPSRASSKPSPSSKVQAKVSAKKSAAGNITNTPKHSNEPLPKQKSIFLSKPNVLYVGDSVGHTASMSTVEYVSNCRKRTARAYSSAYDKGLSINNISSISAI
jgi:hypothetical protein